MDYDTDNLTDAQQLATDAVLGALDDAGISVERVSEEEAEREVEKDKSDSNVQLMLQMEQGTLGLSYHPIAGAKIAKNLETAKRKLETATWREDNLHTKNAARLATHKLGKGLCISLKFCNFVIQNNRFFGMQRKSTTYTLF